MIDYNVCYQIRILYLLIVEKSAIKMASSAPPTSLIAVDDWQGFRQDQIIASHICFGGHVAVNC